MNEKYSSSFSLKLYRLCQRLPLLRYFKILLYFTDIFLIPIKRPKKDNEKRVLVIYNYALGDGVIFLNSARYIKQIYKDYKVTLICQKNLHTLYKNQNVFDEVIPFDLTSATFNMKIRHQLFKKLREQYYNIVLDPIGVNECTTNIYMSRVVCSDEKITIIDETIKSKMCPKWLYNKIYTKIIKVNTPNLSLIEYYASFIRGLGIDFKVNLEKLNVYNTNLKFPKKYGIIFPSASTNMKCYPIDKYAKIARMVYEHTKIPIMLCGTNSDTKKVSEFAEMIKDIPTYNFFSKTSLLEFIELIRNAEYVITNDTSTYHIAVNLEIPVAIITGGYTYNKYVLYNFENMNNYKKPCVIVNNMDCFNCDNKCSKLKPNDILWPCLESIKLDYAKAKIKELLKDNKLWKE